MLHSISAKDTAIKFMSTKVEIKLKKVEGVHWPTLEANAQQLDARRAEALKKRNYIFISLLFDRIIVKFIFDYML